MAEQVQVPMWQSADGRIWGSQAIAERHEAQQAAEEILKSSGLWSSYDSPCLEEVAAWLSENYTLTPKAP